LLDTLKHQDAAIRETSRNLNIQVLLFGTLASRGDRILLQLEIVRGADSVHMASLEYNVSKQQLPSLGDRIQRDVFAAIRSSQTYGGLPHGGTQDPVAYAAYLEARSLADLRTPAAVNAAITQYKTATSRDPHFAKAYAGMATAYEVLAQHHFAPLDASTQQAKELSQTALKIDPACAEAHALLGFIFFAHDWNALAGEKELRTGIGLDPSHAPYHMWLAILLSDEGRTEESLQEMDLAKAADPLWPPIYGTETFVAQNARDTKRVFEAAFTYLKLQPENPLALDQLGWSWWNCGKYREAIDEWRRMAAMEHDIRRMAVEDRGLKEFQRRGVPGYAHVRLEDIHTKPTPTQFPNDYNEAEWYAIAGSRENALVALEQLVNNHDSYALEIGTVFFFNDLHGDPRFDALVKRVGMPLQIAVTGFGHKG
jgi:tetratricopeptide (TPR) repeat protein